MEDAPDTGRIALKVLADAAVGEDTHSAATKQDVAVIAKQVDRLVSASEEAKGAHRTWRILGGAGFSIAMALGAYALNLASQAARDHDRLDRLTVDVEQTGSVVAELQRTSTAQGTTLAASAARIDVQLDRIDDLLARVDRRLDGFEQRLSTIERRR